MDSDGGKQPASKRDWALAHAGMGWRVFPVTEANGQRGSGKIPRIKDWPSQASSDLEQVAAWWKAWPNDNVGIATGRGSNLLVLDADGPEGLDAVERLGFMPDTPTAATGRDGGRHFYFTYPAGMSVGNSVNKAMGLDIRANGGYVVAPGSTHWTGKDYQWLRSPEDAEPADPPPWLLRFIAENSKARTRATDIDGGKVREGGRNSYLTSKGGALVRQNLSLDAVYQALLAENREKVDPPLSDAEVRQIAESVRRYDPASPLITAAWNHEGWAQRVALLYGERLAWVAADKRYYAWNGRYWENDVSLQAEWRINDAIEVTRIAHRLLTSDEILAGQIDMDAAWRAMHQAGQHNNQLAILGQLRRHVETPRERFDGNPALLTVQNGTLDLRTGHLRDYDPADKITMIAGAAWDPGADRREWDRFLGDTFGSDGDLREYVQMCAGYSIGGTNQFELIFHPYGPTRTGKTTFLEAIRAALGTYAVVVDPASFLARRGGGEAGGARPDLARLENKRFGVSSELPEGSKFNTTELKRLSGGDTYAVRSIYKEEKEFAPVVKIWFAGNSSPTLSSDDPAIWERMRRIPFPNHVPPERRDVGLKSRLRNPELNGSAILAWLVEGWQKVQSLQSIKEPEAVVLTNLAYRQESNPLAEFVDERLERIEGKNVGLTPSDMKMAYANWCAEGGVPRKEMLKGARFNAALELLGHRLKQVNLSSGTTIRKWANLGLKEEDE